MSDPPLGSDVIVIGAGMVGAACAYGLAKAGVSVCVVDRGPIVAGTTGAGEGNILVSDKAPGPELDLALWSRELWSDLRRELPNDIELEAKGTVVVATSSDAWRPLQEYAAGQRAAGVLAHEVHGVELQALEPQLAPDLTNAMHYPQDMQVQPMLAAAHMLRAARALGAKVLTYTNVTAVRRDHGGAVTAVRTDRGDLPCTWVVNAAGTWGAHVAQLMGGPIPVLPRRGFILVTEPLPPTINHKVYSADYVANVASSDVELETSAVVEGTRSGTILIGASRERVGFDRKMSYEATGKLASQAIRLFPSLAPMRVQRIYRGFRPYCPDHLPVIGPDARVQGLIHACGHEGAGIGLAPATAQLIVESVLGRSSSQSLEPFSPSRFLEGEA